MARCSGFFLLGALIGALAGAGAVYLSGDHVGPGPGISRQPPETWKPPASAVIPDAATAQALVLDTTLRFAEAINNRDLASFRATTSATFQRAFSLPAFEAAFAGFITQQLNLRVVANMTPVLTTHTPDPEQGSLRLTGYFPTQPSRLLFDYRYTRAGEGWQLSGIDIKVEPQ